jgi:pimeloyl-ACP methyl ester carboxylesterase
MDKVLGCDHYVAQGGDWGGIITSCLAFDHPEKLKAIHLNICGFIPEITDDDPLNAEEQAWMDRYMARRATETAYHQIHGTSRRR